MTVFVLLGFLLLFAFVRWSRRITRAGNGSLKEVNLGYLFKPGKYNMTMGLRRLDGENWLTIVKLLTKSKSKVLQCLPGSEAACVETLEDVVNFLTKMYPDAFEQFFRDDKHFVRNSRTCEVFQLGAPYAIPPLEIAARLAMEDFNVLIKGESDESHILKASATFFPAGWVLEEKIGWPVTKLHERVPLWKDKIGGQMERYFSNMKPSSSEERSSFFVQTTQTLFHPHPFPTSATETFGVHEIVVRHERQTFRRLARSNAILFTVRTYMNNLVDMGEKDFAGFAAVVRAWPDDVASYKGRDSRGPVALKYCDDMTQGVIQKPPGGG